MKEAVAQAEEIFEQQNNFTYNDEVTLKEVVQNTKDAQRFCGLKKHLVANIQNFYINKYILAYLVKITSVDNNFTRIILDLAKKNCNILIPSFSKHLGKNKIGFFKKIILRLLKVIIIEMDAVEKNSNEKLNIPDIKFFY